MSKQKLTVALAAGVLGTVVILSSGSGIALAELNGDPSSTAGSSTAPGNTASAPSTPAAAPAVPSANSVDSPIVPTTKATLTLAPEDKTEKQPPTLKSSLPTKPDNLVMH